MRWARLQSLALLKKDNRLPVLRSFFLKTLGNKSVLHSLSLFFFIYIHVNFSGSKRRGDEEMFIVVCLSVCLYVCNLVCI